MSTEENISFFTEEELNFFHDNSDNEYDAGSERDRNIYNRLQNGIFHKSNYWASRVANEIPIVSIKQDNRPTTQGQRFKKYSWARIYLDASPSQKIFFTLGVADTPALYMRLGYARSIKNNLTKAQIDIFESEIQEQQLFVFFEIPLQKLTKNDWGTLISRTVRFIHDLSPLYLSIAKKIHKIEPPTDEIPAPEEPPENPDNHSKHNFSSYSPDRVTRGINSENDRLGMSHYTRSFARLISSKQLKPPLSIGLFGKWGSGKSFFMNLIRSEIDDLTKNRDTTNEFYIKKIAQVEFNAWHYVEDNLWASLVQKVYEDLAEHALDFRPDKLYLQSVWDSSRIQATTRRLKEELESIQKTLSPLDKERLLELNDIIKDLELHQNQYSNINEWKSNIESIKKRLKNLTSVKGYIFRKFRFLKSRPGKFGLLAITTSFTGLLLITFLTPEKYFIQITLAILPAIGLLKIFWNLFNPLWNWYIKFKNQHSESLDTAIKKLSIPVSKLNTELPENVLKDYLLNMSQEGFNQHLGLITDIHRSFKSLSELIGRAGTETSVERIVLYIDDLDRCPPERVVQVLEAIHLLLNFPNFVVIVGVDILWVIESLHKRFPKLLEDSKSNTARPMDYLEKIFQLPFQINFMEQSSITNFIDELTKTPEKEKEKVENNDEEELGTQKPSSKDDTNNSQPSQNNDTQSKAENSDDRNIISNIIEFTPDEINLIKTLAQADPSTPRNLKRLINIYQLFRAGIIDEKEQKEIDDGAGLLVLLLLGAALLLNPQIFKGTQNLLRSRLTAFNRVYSHKSDDSRAGIAPSDEQLERFIYSHDEILIKIECEDPLKWIERSERYIFLWEEATAKTTED